MSYSQLAKDGTVENQRTKTGITDERGTRGGDVPRFGDLFPMPFCLTHLCHMPCGADRVGRHPSSPSLVKPVKILELTWLSHVIMNKTKIKNLS